MTDHQLGWTAHGVEEFLSGGTQLEELLAEMQALEEAKALDALTRGLAPHTGDS